MTKATKVSIATMVQSLTQIKARLAAAGLRPNRRLGQNFLHDAHKLDAILQAADLTTGECVLEVGPGTGVLTEPMLERGANVIAVEYDRGLAQLLREHLGDRPNLTLIEGDIMAGKHAINADVAASLDRAGDDGFKLIANLPYNIASPLLVTLAIDHPAMRLALVMIQREVAERITAEPWGKSYGPLGVMLQAMCVVDTVQTLSPNCFWPKPKVESRVIRLRRRTVPRTDNPRALAETLHTLFSKRRKQLGTILGHTRELPAGVEPHMRPEQLTVAQLVELANNPSPTPEQRKDHNE